MIHLYPVAAACAASTVIALTIVLAWALWPTHRTVVSK
ncbi:hypothetical protein SEA_TEMPO_105 [Microbacterium phage Tempo]|nr:hypothetical protein SEA_TEMPO_105 [Microbacterium phage Tempo]UOW92850.1 hypothetical protein SEA_ROBINROSE_107 [Microbacterium phage RobinRose]WNT44313.1 hypothetical protein SEA_CANDC_103 [Microbacterium phage CandC]